MADLPEDKGNSCINQVNIIENPQWQHILYFEDGFGSQKYSKATKSQV